MEKIKSELVEKETEKVETKVEKVDDDLKKVEKPRKKKRNKKRESKTENILPIAEDSVENREGMELPPIIFECPVRNQKIRKNFKILNF